MKKKVILARKRTFGSVKRKFEFYEQKKKLLIHDNWLYNQCHETKINKSK